LNVLHAHTFVQKCSRIRKHGILLGQWSSHESPADRRRRMKYCSTTRSHAPTLLRSTSTLCFLLSLGSEFILPFPQAFPRPLPDFLQNGAPRQQCWEYNYHILFAFYHNCQVESNLEAFERFIYEDILNAGGRYEACRGRL
jgi:hypothetical protein